MSEPLDETYLIWLADKVGLSETHWSLLRQLYKREFVWLIPNDDNRMEDGLDLRVEFLHWHDVYDPDSPWLHLGCSFLEMLIALCNHLSFNSYDPPQYWFMRLLGNMGLDHIDDFYYDETCSEIVDEAINNVIWRTYDVTGLGGLFPLERPGQDQTRVELWYQMSAYLNEQ